MRVLAVESSSGQYLSFALLDTSRPVQLCAELVLQPGRELAEVLLPELDGLLRAHDVSVASLDLFAVGLGPGSFTGARIGLATFKGLALATQKPLSGVSSLDCLDPGAQAFPGVRLALLDAGRDELYVQCMRAEACVLPPCLVPRADLAEVLGSVVAERSLVCTGPLAATLALPGWQVRVLAEAPFDRPVATRVAELAASRALRGNHASAQDSADAAALVPLYVRPPDITAPRSKSSR
jgi:tRNA threonylcarbamoyladenosine biosynthesis protein TsaB